MRAYQKQAKSHVFDKSANRTEVDPLALYGWASPVGRGQVVAESPPGRALVNNRIPGPTQAGLRHLVQSHESAQIAYDAQTAGVR